MRREARHICEWSQRGHHEPGHRFVSHHHSLTLRLRGAPGLELWLYMSYSTSMRLRPVAPRPATCGWWESTPPCFGIVAPLCRTCLSAEAGCPGRRPVAAVLAGGESSYIQTTWRDLGCIRGRASGPRSRRRNVKRPAGRGGGVRLRKRAVVTGTLTAGHSGGAQGISSLHSCGGRALAASTPLHCSVVIQSSSSEKDPVADVTQLSEKARCSQRVGDELESIAVVSRPGHGRLAHHKLPR